MNLLEHHFRLQDMEINAEVAVEEEGAEVQDAAGGESDVQVS